MHEEAGVFSVFILCGHVFGFCGPLAVVFADGLVQPGVHRLAPVYAFVALKARSFGLFSIDMWS